MITPIQSNINFTGRVILGAAGHEWDEAAGKKELSVLPKNAQGMIMDEINAFKAELEAKTPDEDIFLLNFATDVRETGMLAQFSPPDGIATGLGMEVLYATSRGEKHKGKPCLWGVLSLAQIDFKSKDKKQVYEGQELKDNVRAVFDKFKSQTYSGLREKKTHPKYLKRDLIMEKEDEIENKAAQIESIEAEIKNKRAQIDHLEAEIELKKAEKKLLEAEIREIRNTIRQI